MTNSEFERFLTRAVTTAAYPTTPDLRAVVMARVAAERPAPRASSRLSFAVTAAVLLLLVAALALLAAAPDSSAVARFFGVDGSKIEIAPAGTTQPPPTSAALPAEADATPRASRLLDTFATPAALPDLRRQRLEPSLPDVPDELQRAYYVVYDGQAISILHYDDFDLWQADLEPKAFFGKLAPAELVLRDVTVNGRPGHWLAGGSQSVWYANSAGVMIAGSELVVERNTLIWRTPRAFYRLETRLSLPEALRIASTLP
jgi:hypothetical protein